MKVVLVGLNYRSHARELQMGVPQEPVIFLKPETAIIGPGDAIYIPNDVGRVDYEGEIAVLIKAECKNISVEESIHVIEGIIALNDITARDIQKKDGQWTRAKGFDTFCPISYDVLRVENWHTEITVSTYLNGRQVQFGSTRDMIFSIPYLISFVSSVMTLKKGDIISTGTPAGIGPIRSGDKVEVVVSVGRRSVRVVNPVI